MEPRDFVREFAEDRIVGGLELPSCQKAHHRRHEAEATFASPRGPGNTARYANLHGDSLGTGPVGAKGRQQH